MYCYDNCYLSQPILHSKQGTVNSYLCPIGHIPPLAPRPSPYRPKWGVGGAGLATWSPPGVPFSGVKWGRCPIYRTPHRGRVRRCACSCGKSLRSTYTGVGVGSGVEGASSAPASGASGIVGVGVPSALASGSSAANIPGWMASNGASPRPSHPSPESHCRIIVISSVGIVSRCAMASRRRFSVAILMWLQCWQRQPIVNPSPVAELRGLRCQCFQFCNPLRQVGYLTPA